MITAILLFCALNLAGLLWAEASDRQQWRWLFKPLAAACFIALALHCGAADSDYGRYLLAGLVLCWFGDVFLIPKQELSFLLGLGSFLLGHVLYIVSFMQLPLNLLALAAGALPALLLAGFSLRWLWPHVGRKMRLPVVAYILVISVMVCVATGSWGLAPAALVIAGAWGFAASDIAVARNQFVTVATVNRMWGLPLYFGSQLLLAYSPTLA
jgi:uncharacterized membrane protein YhhN